jgi:uncharacterized protein (DUF2147 family)
MMKRVLRCALLLPSLLLFIADAPVCGQTARIEGDAVLGEWITEEGKARVEVYRCGEAYCGKIVWLKEPNYPEGSKDGIPGTPKIDHHNPDLQLRTTPIIGLQIVHAFSYGGEDLWKDGKIYDPKNGKTYSGKMTLVSPRQLDLRGFIGISLIGRTTTWTR